MIGLHRKVNDTKPRPRALPEGGSHFEEDHLLAQTRKAPTRTQRHMQRVPALVHGPRSMRDAIRYKAPSWVATAPALAKIQRELTGRVPHEGNKYITH